MIFGLFFRIGVLLVLVLAIGHAIAVYEGTGFRVALPSIEMCFVLAGLLFIGPGKYSVDKTYTMIIVLSPHSRFSADRDRRQFHLLDQRGDLRNFVDLDLPPLLQLFV